MWRTIRRETSLVEHVCPDGIGHPNKYSVARLHKYDCIQDDGTYRHSLKECHWHIHGCDGCCHSDDFLGRWLSKWEIIERLDRITDQFIYDASIDHLEMAKWLSYTAHDLMVNFEFRDAA